MPTFAYSNSDFVAFTKARAADVNTRFNDIKTFFNTTKLDDSNIQDAGITRATKLKVGTANGFVINNSTTGAMSELVAGNSQVITTNASGVPTALTALTTGLGGTGQSLDISANQDDDVLKVATGVFTVGATPTPAPVKIFNFYRFT